MQIKLGKIWPSMTRKLWEWAEHTLQCIAHCSCMQPGKILRKLWHLIQCWTAEQMTAWLSVFLRTARCSTPSSGAWQLSLFLQDCGQNSSSLILIIIAEVIIIGRGSFFVHQVFPHPINVVNACQSNPSDLNKRQIWIWYWYRLCYSEHYLSEFHKIKLFQKSRMMDKELTRRRKAPELPLGTR